MKIAFISSDWGGSPKGDRLPGGSGMVRMAEPASFLQKYGGHECLMTMNVAVRKDGAMIPADFQKNPLDFEPDIVVLQRWMWEKSPKIIKNARKIGQVVIHEIDDYFLGLHPTNAAYKGTDPKRHPHYNRDHYHAGMRAASMITVSTPFLADRYGKYLNHKNIVVIRNAVDVPRYPKNQVRNVDTGIRVGWVGVVRYRSEDLETLQGVLDPYLREVKGTFVHHAAQFDNFMTAPKQLGLGRDINFAWHPMVSSLDYPMLMQNFDFGIVPLNRVPFNDAKSCIKGMEYAASRIPFIAEGSPEYRWFNTGEICDSPEEWSVALKKLTDPVYRKEKSQEVFERVLKEDYSVRWKDWEQAYMSATP